MNKQQLANRIWASANNMRNKIDANEYKDKIIPVETATTTKAKQESTEKATVKPKEKPIVIPAIETLEGTVANIMYHRCGKLACGAYCKLDQNGVQILAKKQR